MSPLGGSPVVPQVRGSQESIHCHTRGGYLLSQYYPRVANYTLTSHSSILKTICVLWDVAG